MAPWNKHPDEVRAEAIRLLLEGLTPEDVSEATSVKKNTIISWRTTHRKETGVVFPKHHLAKTGRKPTVGLGTDLLQGFKYTDDEIILLVRQNPGFGIERFCKKLYPKTKSVAELRYLVTMLLNEHFTEKGEDLYDLLQDPDFSTLVSENEYRRITGKNIPSGYGRSGGRNRAGQRINRDVRHKMTMIPIPPQEFNWGYISSSEVRTILPFERIISPENPKAD
jgi:transposase-like protein